MQSPASDPKKIWRERHKRWGTPSPWVAEHIANIAKYCQSPEGKIRFEDWVRKEYKEEAPEVLRACAAKPKRMPRNVYLTTAPFIENAGDELGLSRDAIIEYYKFNMLDPWGLPFLQPERVLPAPEKRRGESCAKWMMRKIDAEMCGHKLPNPNMAELRRIAYSQVDAIRDQMVEWRTQPEIFVEVLKERAASTILSPGVPEDEAWRTSLNNALQNCLHVAHIEHDAWSQASALMDRLDAAGLSSPRAIIDAFENDVQLLGEMAATLCAVKDVGWLWRGRFMQAITFSPAIRPYIDRFRHEDGVADYRVNELYLLDHPVPQDSLESFVVEAIRLGINRLSDSTFFRQLAETLARPGENIKLSQEAYDAIGEYSIAYIFSTDLHLSPLGFALRDACSVASRVGTTKGWKPLLCSIADEHLGTKPSGDAFSEFDDDFKDNLTRCQSITWLNRVFQMDAGRQLDILVSTRKWVPFYDWLWWGIDRVLLDYAMGIESAPGKLSKRYGLLDPSDPERPRFATRVAQELKYKQEKERASKAPVVPEPFVSSIPIATPQDAVAKAPELPPGETRPKKTRAQSRKKRASCVAEQPSTSETRPLPVAREERPASPEPPDALPTSWRLGRKHLEVFRRMFCDDEKTGHIRWNDFEKAMKQLGFETSQTEGSSVRFDPPARTARPVTFHRPHPDPILTPALLKWVGARLTRVYGWTEATFLSSGSVDVREQQDAVAAPS